jgi:hypothetical protein
MFKSLFVVQLFRELLSRAYWQSTGARDERESLFDEKMIIAVLHGLLGEPVQATMMIFAQDS